MPARIGCRGKMRNIVFSGISELRWDGMSSICVVFSSGTAICRNSFDAKHAWESWHASNERRIKFNSALKSQCYFTSVSRGEESRAKTGASRRKEFARSRIRILNLDIRRDQHRKWVISGDISGGGDKIGRKRSLDELQTGLCWFNAITSSPIK